MKDIFSPGDSNFDLFGLVDSSAFPLNWLKMKWVNTFS